MRSPGFPDLRIYCVKRPCLDISAGARQQRKHQILKIQPRDVMAKQPEARRPYSVGYHAALQAVNTKGDRAAIEASGNVGGTASVSSWAKQRSEHRYRGGRYETIQHSRSHGNTTSTSSGTAAKTISILTSGKTTTKTEDYGIGQCWLNEKQSWCPKYSNATMQTTRTTQVQPDKIHSLQR